jgi:hypothetical protein
MLAADKGTEGFSPLRNEAKAALGSWVVQLEKK